MDWKFFLALIFALIVAIFALQNSADVEISFITLEFSVSQALVILASAAFGALAVLLLSLKRWIKYQSKLRSATKSLSALENENGLLKIRLEEYAAKNEKEKGGAD
jgi:putative membrane protein